MTMQEVGEMLALMKTAWPNFYAKQDRESAQAAVKMWHGVLQAEHAEVVLCALHDCIRTCTYPPVPADIHQRIQAMKNVLRPGASEAFVLLKRAAKRGYYNAEEEYATLPDACKAFLGGPSGLRDLSLLEENTLDTVTRGQFMRQYDTLVERERIKASMPANVYALLQDLTDQLPCLLEGETS